MRLEEYSFFHGRGVLKYLTTGETKGGYLLILRSQKQIKVCSLMHSYCPFLQSLIESAWSQISVDSAILYRVLAPDTILTLWYRPIWPLFTILILKPFADTKFLTMVKSNMLAYSHGHLSWK